MAKTEPTHPHHLQKSLHLQCCKDRTMRKSHYKASFPRVKTQPKTILSAREQTPYLRHTSSTLSAQRFAWAPRTCKPNRRWCDALVGKYQPSRPFAVSACWCTIHSKPALCTRKCVSRLGIPGKIASMTVQAANWPLKPGPHQKASLLLSTSNVPPAGSAASRSATSRPRGRKAGHVKHRLSRRP